MRTRLAHDLALDPDDSPLEAHMRLLTTILVSAGLCACGSPQIRIANRSNVALENVLVRFPSQAEDFGTIAPNEVTEYREIERAYSVAYIETTVGGQPAILQPIDHVGDKLLGRGQYTYALTVNANAQSPHERLRFEFIKD